MKKAITAILGVILILSTFSVNVLATQNTEDIVILYENDVHCEISGYSKLAALKRELEQTYAHVGAVSSGDYIQGSSIGVVSKGEYIVKLMNLVGYDAVTLGNHEFDYHLPRLEELIGMMNTKPVCCNFSKLDSSESYFDPYSIVSYGDVDVAFLGITTPSTTTSSSPAQFKDEAGNFIFTFHGEDLYDVVQKNIDAAVKDGADYVIALSHIGDIELTYSIEELIANTSGLDAVLDAHSHSVIEGRVVKNEAGDDVILTSTGTKFEHIGKLTISGGKITTELIKTADLRATDPEVDAYLKQIEEEYSKLGDRKIAVSEVDLITHDEQGNRLVRIAETNLGDLCADAYRYVMDADVGYVNGGGIRNDLPAGDVTFNDLLNVFPFNNQAVLAEISGQTLKDMLEMAMMTWPLEDGSFPHMSGITFSVNTSIPSSVVLNEVEEFCGVSGQYRVYDIRIFNKDTQKYEPLVLTDTYTIASHNYFLLECGSGMTMLKDVKILQNDGMLDVELFEKYVVEHLNGVIGEEYRETRVNVTFTDGELTSSLTSAQIWLIVGVSAACLIIIAAAVIIIVRKNVKR